MWNFDQHFWWFFEWGKEWKHFHQIWQKFCEITKFGEKSCVNVTKLGETKCCDIIFTKFGEILIEYTKLGENSVVCWFVDNFGESPNWVTNPVLIMSHNLVKLNFVILFSSNLVKLWSNSPNMVKIPILTNKISSYFPTNFGNFSGVFNLFAPNMVKTLVINFNCWHQFHEKFVNFLGVKFVIFLMKIFSPNMVNMISCAQGVAMFQIKKGCKTFRAFPDYSIRTLETICVPHHMVLQNIFSRLNFSHWL